MTRNWREGACQEVLERNCGVKGKNEVGDMGEEFESLLK
jgi:hypothetical protein